jgi:hypothetical protein
MTYSIFDRGRFDFLAVRNPHDIDLVSEVRRLLVEAGLEPQVVQHFDTHHLMVEAAPKIPEVQRYFLNRYWTLQLLASGLDTQDQRRCLLRDGKFTDWLGLFRDNILPFAILHRLPMDIHESRVLSPEPLHG